ncbi:MAG: helix-turn-helix domain-containing protein [Tumebacillaceae bacterium]
MQMSTEVWTLTEKTINRAFEQHDAALLEKETMFVMNNIVCAISEIYSNILYAIKPVRVRLKRTPELLFKEDYLASLKKILVLSERLHREQIDFAEAKLHFDVWFYQVTTDGVVMTDYKSDSLVSITEAAEVLGVSRAMIYKYMDRGLETVGEKGSQKIPRFILEAWKNPALAFKIQWIHGVKRARTQSDEEKLEFINKQIFDFEKEYQGTFHHLFGHLSNEEIDTMAEAVDITDWKHLEDRKRQLLQRLKV